jgi:PAS domain S-box-containing protein
MGAPSIVTLLRGHALRLLGLGFGLILLLGLALGGVRRQDVVAENRLQAESLRRYVALYLDDVFAVLDAVAATSPEPGFIAARLGHLQAALPRFARLVFIAADGRVLADVPGGLEGLDFPDLFAPETGGRGTEISRPLWSPQTGRMTVFLRRGVPAGGQVVCELSLDELQSHVQRFAAALPGGSVILADAYGNLIVHPDARQVAQQANLGHLPFVTENRGRTFAAGHLALDGRRYLASLATLAGPGWVVLILTPLWSVYAPPLATLAALLACLLAGYAAMISYLLRDVRRRVSRPLTELAAAVERAGQGGAEVRPPAGAFREAEVMAEGFNRALAVLAEREAALRASEREYREIFEQAVEGIFRSRPDGRLLAANPAMARTLGYDSPGELVAGVADIGRDLYVREVDRLRLLDILGRQGRVSGYETQFKRKDGLVIWVSMNARALLAENGAVLAFEAMVQDVTMRKSAEVAVRESERRYRELFEHAAVGIFLADGRRRLLEANPQAAAILGYDDPLQLRGLGAEELIHPEDLARQPIYFPDGRLPLDAYSRFERRYRSRSGGWVPVEVLVRMLSPDRQLVMFQDISRRKETEARLIQAKELAEAASRSKSEFLANVSHELRTPLNGVLGMLQLLEDTPQSAQQRHFTEIAQVAGCGLLTIINDILSISRLESGVLALASEPFDLPALVKGMSDLFSQEAAGRGLDFRVSADPDLPGRVRGDEGRLRQIILNLVGNALKFTDQGGVSLTVGRLPGPAESCRLYIEVADTGIGIPPDKLNLVFEPFTQVDGSFTRRHQGAGLGLGIVKRLVALMGGGLCLDSAPGEGTTVGLSLPLALAGEAPARAPAATPEVGRSLKVLVVEDERINSLALKGLLERLGHAATCADTGQEGLALLAEKPFDVVLMDIQMPDMDGLAVTARIRNHDGSRFDPGLPVVAVTAHAMDGHRESFLAAGMDDYLAKPVLLPDLARVLVRVTAGRPPAGGGKKAGEEPVK